MSAINIPAKIEIRPIPNRDQMDKYSTTLSSFAQAHIVGPSVDPVTRKYATGLTEEDREYLISQGLGMNLEENFIRGVVHETWESQLLKTELIASPMFLYPSTDPIDFLKFKYLQKSRFVYSSEEELNEGGKTEATHFIYNEEQELQLKAITLEKHAKLLAKVAKLSSTKKKAYLTVILDEHLDNKNDDYITVALDRVLLDKDLVGELEALLERGDQEVILLSEIKSAIRKNALKETKEGIYYFETRLGFSYEEVLETLNKPDMQEVYLAIKSKIQ